MRKSATPRKNSSARKKANDVDVVGENMKKLRIQNPIAQNFIFDFHFPSFHFTITENTKEIVYLCFLSINLPLNYIQEAKVLKGGNKFSLLMGVPKWFYEENLLRRMMGADYHPDHARVQAHSKQVVQPVRKLANNNDPWILGKPQVVDLPIQVIEKAYQPTWGNWNTAGMARVTGQSGTMHRQFQKTIQFRLESVENTVEKTAAAVERVYGYLDDDIDDESDYEQPDPME